MNRRSALQVEQQREQGIAVFAPAQAYHDPVAVLDHAVVLDRLTDDDWARAGTHSESGAYSVNRWLEIYAEHAAKHAAQIRRARG